MSIILTARLGSHTEKLFVVDNWHNHYSEGELRIEPSFNSYYEIHLSTIRERISDSYLNDMYDYIAQSGDVSYIDIVFAPNLSEEEHKAWEEEILAKFPLMEEYDEQD